MEIGQRIREARKRRNISQEMLAERAGISVQAVSKWECELSYPDIVILPLIADYLQVSLDYLLREEGETGKTTDGLLPGLPEDDTVRVLQCVGNRIVECREKNGEDKMPSLSLKMPEPGKNPDVQIEIWGNAEIDGDVCGSASAGGNLNCQNVNGNATAAGNMHCHTVNGSVSAAGNAKCHSVQGDIYAGGNVRSRDGQA